MKRVGKRIIRNEKSCKKIKSVGKKKKKKINK